MNFFVLTLFPQVIQNAINFSILKRALDKEIIKVFPINIRDYAFDKHKTTDLPPYGGGEGMILKPEPIFLAVEDLLKTRGIKKEEVKIILLSASGKLFTQKIAKKYAKDKNIILICGHYEGVDHRVAEKLVDEEISIGQFVLSGGEYAALVIVDTVSRLIKEVLGNKNSNKKESFEKGFMEHPQYTRPADFRGYKVPGVLISGNHEKIEEWKKQNSPKYR